MTLDPIPGTATPEVLSPLAAIGDLRAAARWIIGAEAVVGATLLGAVPLAGIGKIHGQTAIMLALAGLLLGLAGVGWAIWQTAEALIPPVTTLALLLSPELARCRELLVGSWIALEAPAETAIEQLHRRQTFWATTAGNLAVMCAAEQDPSRQRLLDRALADAKTNESQIRNYLRWILELCHVWRVQQQVRRARMHTMIGGLASAIGVVLILAAASGQ